MKQITGIASIVFFLAAISAILLILGEQLNLFTGVVVVAICCSGFSLSLSNYILVSNNYSIRGTGLASLLLFAIFTAHYFHTALYIAVWNYLLVFHVLIIGYALFRLVNRGAGLLKIVTSGLIILTALSLSLILLFRLHHPVLYDVIFFVMIANSVAIVLTLFLHKAVRTS